MTDTTRLVRTQGVTAPAGFRATGIAAGIKASGALDLALVFNEGPDHGAAGVFTRNKVKAAPVLWSQQVLTTGALRAVILNSGGANACTGPRGFQDTHATAEAVAAALSDWGTETGAIEVAVCSTGLIGDRLPMDKVLAGVTEVVHEMADLLYMALVALVRGGGSLTDVRAELARRHAGVTRRPMTAKATGDAP